MSALSLGESSLFSSGVLSDQKLTLEVGLSVAPLPYQMMAFYTLFSRLTILAIV